MKFLSQLFEDRGTDWTFKAFRKARLKLIVIYLLIIAVVIGLFAYLVMLQVQDRVASQKLPADSQIVMSASDAQKQASLLKPEQTIISTEYQLEDNTILYELLFSDGYDVEVDLLTGEIRLEEDTEDKESLFTILTDDMEEVIWWLGLIVFLIASIGSIIVANVTLKPIVESVKKQKRFVSDASHELRNPLASLRTTLESYIRDNNKSKQLNESVAKDLLTEVNRLIVTSESLLALEKNELHNRNVTDCSVAQSVDRVDGHLKNMLGSKNITLKKQIIDTSVRIDPKDLDTILYNVIHNAIKFSHENSEVTIRWDGSNLSVSDAGVGIEAKHIPHIFDRFYKADEARGFETSSNGLGLALVNEIVASYGGQITVDSHEGKGAHFNITF